MSITVPDVKNHRTDGTAVEARLIAPEGQPAQPAAEPCRPRPRRSAVDQLTGAASSPRRRQPDRRQRRAVHAVTSRSMTLAVWARGVARRATVTFWPVLASVPGEHLRQVVVAAPAPNQSLLTAGVVSTIFFSTSSKVREGCVHADRHAQRVAGHGQRHDRSVRDIIISEGSSSARIIALKDRPQRRHHRSRRIGITQRRHRRHR